MQTTILALLFATLTAALPVAVVIPDSSSTPPSTTATSSDVSPPSSATKLPTTHPWPAMENPHLFEGDLKISQEMIYEYYGIEEKSTKVSLLAVV